MGKESKSLIKIHVAVFFFGLAGLFGKWLLLPSVIITLGRVVFAAIALLGILLYKKQKIKLDTPNDYVHLVLLGMALAISWVTFFQSIQMSTVAIGLLTFSTFPVFTTFIEPYFFNEKIKSKDIFLALIVFIGVALVIPEYKFESNMTQGAIWGIVSGLSFAFLQIFNRKYVKKYSSLVITFYQTGVASIVLLPFLFCYVVEYSSQDIFLLILLGVIFTAVSHTLFIDGLQHVRVQTASIITALEPVYGILFATLLLNEIPTLRVLIGGVIILGGVISVTFRKPTIQS